MYSTSEQQTRSTLLKNNKTQCTLLKNNKHDILYLRTINTMYST